jgi:hypothetical protein
LPSKTRQSLQVWPSSSLCVHHSCLSVPPRVLAPPPIVLPLPFPSLHSPCLATAPFDSDSLPHDSHTCQEVFVLTCSLNHFGLNVNMISSPSTMLDFIRFQYFRFPIVQPLWFHCLSICRLCLWASCLRSCVLCAIMCHFPFTFVQFPFIPSDSFVSSLCFPFIHRHILCFLLARSARMFTFRLDVLGCPFLYLTVA